MLGRKTDDCSVDRICVARCGRHRESSCQICSKAGSGKIAEHRAQCKCVTAITKDEFKSFKSANALASESAPMPNASDALCSLECIARGLLAWRQTLASERPPQQRSNRMRQKCMPRLAKLRRRLEPSRVKTWHLKVDKGAPDAHFHSLACRVLVGSGLRKRAAGLVHTTVEGLWQARLAIRQPCPRNAPWKQAVQGAVWF